MQHLEKNIPAAPGTGCLPGRPQSGTQAPGTRYLNSSNFLATPGTGCLSGTQTAIAHEQGTRYLNSPHQERVRHLLYGSLAGLDRTIKILHSLGYADPNDWSEPIPTGKPNQWMVIMTKILLIE